MGRVKKYHTINDRRLAWRQASSNYYEKNKKKKNAADIVRYYKRRDTEYSSSLGMGTTTPQEEVIIEKLMNAIKESGSLAVSSSIAHSRSLYWTDTSSIDNNVIKLDIDLN